MNIWVPDGMKDITVDRFAPRQRLLNALDEVISEKNSIRRTISTPLRANCSVSAPKAIPLAPMNSTWATPPAVKPHCARMPATSIRRKSSPTKISAAMLYIPRLLLHVSRPVRWDSDHVVLLDDETRAIASEIIRHNLFDRVHIGLDFFDASINRIAAWVIGTRNMKKPLLRALLEPTALLRQLEKRR